MWPIKPFTLSMPGPKLPSPGPAAVTKCPLFPRASLEASSTSCPPTQSMTTSRLRSSGLEARPPRFLSSTAVAPLLRTVGALEAEQTPITGTPLKLVDKEREIFQS